MLSRGTSWEETRDRISEEIASGRLLPDARLPPEPELCRLFSARRHSLRRALQALQAEGKLRIEHGRGVFVERAPLVNYVVGSRTRFRENLMSQGLAASGETISEARIEADIRVARALAVPVNTPVIAICGRGFANELPISLSWSYHEAGRFPDMIEKRRAGVAVTDIYRAYGIADYRRLQTTIYTRPANDHEASLLMLRPGQAVLVVRKIDVDLEGKPVGFSEGVWAGDRVQFTFENPIPDTSERTNDAQ